MSLHDRLWRIFLLRQHPELADIAGPWSDPTRKQPPTNGPMEYRVTFGHDHQGRRLPCGCGVDPAGWLSVAVEHGVPVEQVAEVVFSMLGADWASLYVMGVEQSPGGPAVPGYAVDWARFPLGELHQITIRLRS